MNDCGLCTIYKLSDVSSVGDMPERKLVNVATAYYEERTIGVTRSYAALSAGQSIDKLIRCYNTTVSDDDEIYVVLEDSKQYRVTLKQRVKDDVDLTLERTAENYDIDS